LQRPLSAKVSVHARRLEARGKVGRLLWVTSARTSQATVTRNEFANTSFVGTEKQINKKKDTVMKIKNNLLTKISFSLGLAIALAFASGCATNTGTGDQMKPMKGGEHQMMLSK
jgi:hypothetical protein